MQQHNEEYEWEKRVRRNIAKLRSDNTTNEYHKTPDQMRKDIKDLQLSQMIMSIIIVALVIFIGGMYKGWW